MCQLPTPRFFIFHVSCPFLRLNELDNGESVQDGSGKTLGATLGVHGIVGVSWIDASRSISFRVSERSDGLNDMNIKLVNPSKHVPQR